MERAGHVYMIGFGRIAAEMRPNARDTQASLRNKLDLLNGDETEQIKPRDWHNARKPKRPHSLAFISRPDTLACRITGVRGFCSCALGGGVSVIGRNSDSQAIVEGPSYRHSSLAHP